MRDWLTTGDCARVIGVTADYIRGEIRDRRLDAEILSREPAPGRRWGRNIIRVYPDAFRAYLERYWPRVQWPAA